MDAVTLFLLLAAPAVGSFAGLVADRIETGEDILLGRSRCDACGRRLAVRDLVPVLSWLAGRGRARCCGARLRLWLPLVELAALGLTVWAVLAAPWPISAVSVGLGWVLLILSLVDLRVFRLPDWGTLPLIAAGGVLSVAGMTGSPAAHLAGAVLGYGALAGIAWAYRRWRGTEGLGLGDAKLLAAAGAWVGVAGLPSVLLIGSLAGLAHALALGAGRGTLSARLAIPFGPSLAAGFWITWLHGPLLLTG